MRAAAKLHHANIVTVYEHGQAEGLHFYTMALVRGGDLKGRIRAHPGGMPPAEAAEGASAVARALACAHEHGFVHRDVKPENILFAEDGTPQLADFGIVRRMARGTMASLECAGRSEDGLVIGTPCYMSPEQAGGLGVDRRSDLYSLGVVLYEMLTGGVPFKASEPLAVLHAHIHEAPPPLPGSLSAWQPIVDRALAKSPDDRYSSAGEFAAVLSTGVQAAAATPRGAASAPAGRARPARVSRSRRQRRPPAREVVPQAAGQGRERSLLFGSDGFPRISVPQAAGQGRESFFRRPRRARAASRQAGAAREPRAGARPRTSAAGRRGLQSVLPWAVLPFLWVVLAVTMNLPGDDGGSSAPSGGARTAAEGQFVPPPVIDDVRRNRTPTDEWRHEVLAELRETLQPPGYWSETLARERVQQEAVQLQLSPEVSVSDLFLNGATSWPEDRAPRDERGPSTGENDSPVSVSELELADEVAEATDFSEAVRRDTAELLLEKRLFDEPPASDSPQETDEASRPRPLDGQTFRDALLSGGSGPEMVVIPAGSFRMGCVSGVDCGIYAKPVHWVTIAEAFAVGRYEVTFGEWDACVSAGGCGRRADDGGWGRGNRPAINVSWADAREYVQWLSRQTGAEYRLLSESEWEYAARAGTSTAYSWGNEIGRNRANCDGCGSRWDDESTAPVGSFRPNAFGLYDMHGNVAEWVDDCWNDSYRGAPSDGSARRAGDCSRRVLRGGSWSSYLSWLRSASRMRDSTEFRDSYRGFRVARAVTP